MKKLKLAFAVAAVALLCVSGKAVSKGEPIAGNNLSFPVIWSEGKKLDLRGEFGATVLLGQSTTNEYGTWYHQQDPGNTWQAQSQTPMSEVDVSWIDWGDNLEAQPWTIRSKVRTEVVLYKDVSASPMTGFEMRWLFGEGIDEVWGTSGDEYYSDEATVYSGVARFTIQKLEVVPYDESHNPIDNSLLGLTWNATDGQWEGDEGKVGALLYNSAVWQAEGVKGKALASIYSAELNVPGKVIYGYNWDLRRFNDDVGYYRLTFSLDDQSTGCPIERNTFFTEETQVVLKDSVQGGGVAVVDYENNLTYIDILIVPVK